MRTVDEILEGISDIRFNIPMPFNYNMLSQAINEARKECIEECARVARSKTIHFTKKQQERKCPAMVNCEVDKKRILSLIDELK